MKISFRFIPILLLAALAFATLGVLPACAQPPEQTPLEKTNLVLKKMRDENIAPQKAFDDGLLTKDVLLFALSENGVLDTQPGQWENMPETLAWTQLLMEKFPEAVAKPDELPTGVQIKIARWYFSKNDKRGAEIMENILKNLPRENPDMGVANVTIFYLSKYYKSIGETEKSIATSLRMQEFTKEPAMLSSSFFRAAQTASEAGDTVRAKQLYEQVIATNEGWMTAQSIIALSQILSKEGKLNEARALLQKPVEGANAEEIRLQLDNELMQSYFSQGEWEETQKWAKTVIEDYDALKNPDKTQRWQWVVENAKRMPQQIEMWKKSPVQLYAREISLRIAADETEAVHTSFNVHSYRDITVKAVSDNPAIGVWPLQLPENYRSNSYQMLDVEITPAAFPKAVGEETKADITVSFEEFPDTVFHVPVVITLEEKAK
jgi:hypothetical protein